MLSQHCQWWICGGDRRTECSLVFFNESDASPLTKFLVNVFILHSQFCFLVFRQNMRTCEIFPTDYSVIAI